MAVLYYSAVGGFLGSNSGMEIRQQDVYRECHVGQHLWKGGQWGGREQVWPEGEAGLQHLPTKLGPSVVPGGPRKPGFSLLHRLSHQIWDALGRSCDLGRGSNLQPK